MTKPTTIRERLRAQVILFNNNDLPAHERAYQMAEHAVAALNMLDNADWDYELGGSGNHLLIYDVPNPATLDTAVQSLEGGPSMFKAETAEEHYTRTCTGDAGNTRPCGCDFPKSEECECDTSCAHCWPDFHD